ncbi:MAG TPA: SLBB domain-containing protein [Gemmatimonadales bacterium]
MRLVFLLACALAVPPGIIAQVPTASQIEQLRNNPELVRQRLRASGMTPDQIRSRLAAAGYSPTLLDAYLDENALIGPTPPTDQALAALQLLGVPPVEAEGLESVVTAVGPDSAAITTAPVGMQLFGLDVFRGPTTQFQPLLSGPVPPTYRIGPGDVLVLVLTGDVELVHELSVTREGYTVIPQVGQLFVNGITMDQLNRLLRDRLGRAYSGVRNGTTLFDVTVARLRTNQVFVVGEVTQPGAYQLASVATVLNALYAAGGPTDRGNFRSIVLRRQGDTTGVFDLYDYLLRGDTRNDLVLEQGDVVFVPTQETRVTLRGAVVRPAIYELRPEETLRDLLAAAGGFRSNAALQRIAIARVVPPAQRGPTGPDRITVDVPVEQVRDGLAPPFPIEPGDEVMVFSVPDDQRAMVRLEGAVYQPGEYGWRPGLRLSELIALGGGLRPAVVTERVLIERLDPVDSTRFVVAARLPPDSSAPWTEDPELRDYDVVRIFSRERFREDRTVGIRGMVNEPGRYPYRNDMTLRDLVLEARGMRDGARLDSAEVATLPAERTGGILSVVRRVPIDSTYTFESDSTTYPMLPGLPGGQRGSAADVPLEPFDEVLILRQPDFELQRVVTISGEVANPGTYALQRKDERLSELVARAGGVLPTAYVAGARLNRAQDDAGRVDIRLERALAQPGRDQDIILRPGDSVAVPEYIATVRVEGAVASPTSVLYRAGAGLGYYIENAGGLAENGDAGRISVRYANGQARTAGRFLFLRQYPQPEPGAVVHVPVRTPGEPFNVTSLLASIAQILASTVAIIAIATR